MSSSMPWEGLKLEESVRVIGKQPPKNETATAAMVRDKPLYERPIMYDKYEENGDEEISFEKGREDAITSLFRDNLEEAPSRERDKVDRVCVTEKQPLNTESIPDSPNPVVHEDVHINDKEKLSETGKLSTANDIITAAPVRDDLVYEKSVVNIESQKKNDGGSDRDEERNIVVSTEDDKLINNETDFKSDTDDVDEGNKKNKPKSPKKWPPKFNIYHLLLAFVSFITFGIDYGTDVHLIIRYYFNNEIALFITSLAFIALPSIVSGIISAIWHRAAYEENNKRFKDEEKDDQKELEWKRKHQQKSKKSYILMTVLSFVQLGRLARQLQYIILIGNSIRLKRKISRTENKREREDLERKDRNLRNRAISEKRDTAMLGLIDGFLESALQLVLQLYLAMLLSLPFDLLRVSSLCASLVSTSLIHTSYYRTNRRATQKKESVSYFSAIFYFLMRFFELAPRYLLLAMFCVVFRPWSFVAIPAHILFVLVLYKSENPPLEGICPTETGPCLLKSLQHLFILMMSYLGLFGFVNLFEEKTRRPAAIFYSVFYAENIVITGLLLWYLVTYNMYIGWVYALWAMPIGLVCHAIFGTLFYEVFHPNIWNARFPNFCKCKSP